jgi:peptide chain release factor 1
MLDKLEALAARHEELLRGMADPQVLASPDRFQQLAREQASLAETVATFRKYQRVLREADEAAGMAQGEQDPELRELARAEEARLRVQQQSLEGKLRELLMPKDPLADRNIIMEIRAGAGGDEASLFAGELFRMYSRYAERNRWKVEVLESSPTALRGFKEIVFAIQGKGVYRRLK